MVPTQYGDGRGCSCDSSCSPHDPGYGDGRGYCSYWSSQSDDLAWKRFSGQYDDGRPMDG